VKGFVETEMEAHIYLIQTKTHSVTLYNTGALICINSCLTNAQIIMS